MACKAPSRGSGTVQVSVCLSGKDSSDGVVFFEYGGSADISRLSVSSGPQHGGSEITVYGAGLASNSSYTCVIGHRKVAATLLEGDSVRCVTPSSSVAASVSVSLMMDGETLPGTLSFEYFETPSIVTLVPSRGHVGGGSHVSIVGTGFSESGLQCRFGTQYATGSDARFITASQVVCITPSGVGAGPVEVEISLNEGADYTSDGVKYLYEAAATVVSVTPSRAFAGSDGQVVTVVGSNFDQTADLSCRFGMSGRSRARYLSSSLVACTAPASGAGSVQVSVSLNGVDSSSGSALFMFAPRASVLWITPSTGPLAGGSMVTVTGDAASLRDVVGCVFGTKTVSAQAAGSGSLVCESPTGAEVGAVSVRLTTSHEQAGVESGLSFVYHATVVVSSLTPRHGSVSGGTAVRIAGSGFEATGLVCKFGPESVSGSNVDVISSTMVVCRSPVSGQPGAVAVSVSCNDGADFSQDGPEYMYGLEAVAESVRPSGGVSVLSGQRITVSGQNFEERSTLACFFGDDTSLQADYVSSTSVVCSVPVKEAGWVSVSISNNGVDSRSFVLYNFLPRSGAVSFHPSRAPVSGGTQVTVAGVGIGNTEVESSCLFGDIAVKA